MKPSSFVILALLILLAAPIAGAQTELLDQVVAVVNDEAITQSELDIHLRPLYQEYKNEYQGSQLEAMLGDARQKLLRQLIEDKLVFQEAKTQKIEIEEAEIDRRMAEFKKKFPDELAMEASLEREGLTLSDMRERLTRQFMIRRLQDMEIRSKIVVSPLEVEEYYEAHAEEFASEDQLRVRSITIKKSGEARDKGITDEDAKARAEDLRKKILSGESFGLLAKQYSEDSNARLEGLGEWMPRGSMIPEIDRVVFALKEGEVSPVIETPMGYHIFRIEEKKDKYRKSLEEVRDQIFSFLYGEKAQKRFQEWMEELKQTAYISIR